MKKLTITIVLALLCPIFRVAAQDTGTPPGLKAGDQLPDLTIQNVMNNKSSTLKTSDFKGKLLIIDFWATWCSPCVAMIPKMQKLQAQFGEQIRFLPVAYQTKAELLAFNKKYPVKKKDLPEVYGDKVLSGLFPHTYLPHYVWIDASGKVLKITGFEAVNAENITAALKGSAINGDIKNDIEQIPYDPQQPLFTNNNGGNGKETIARSVLSGYVPGLPASERTIDDPKDPFRSIRVTFTNTSIAELLQMAYGEKKIRFMRNRTIIQVKNYAAVQQPDDMKAAQWVANYPPYTYEISVPEALSANTYKMMQQDLARYFPQYEAKVENRKVKCLVLVRTTSEDKLKTKGGRPGSGADEFGMHMTNCNMAVLPGWLNLIYLQLSPMPVIDKTGYEGKIDMDFQANLSNVDSINKGIGKYGLQLKEQEEVIPMLIISDKAP